jgi:hypothetical protein
VAQVAQQHRRSVDVVDRDIEEALDLVSVQIHGQHAGHADSLQQVGHHFGRDRYAGGARPPVLARIAEIRNHRADPLGRGALERVDHDQQFHQVFVGRRAGGLHHEDVPRPHVGADLDGHFSVGKAAYVGRAQRNAQVTGDLRRKGGIGVTREHHEIGMWNNLHDRSQRLRNNLIGVRTQSFRPVRRE